MSERHKTDVELLQCSQRVDSSLFPKALSNRIAQDYGKYVQLQWQTSRVYTKNTIYIFVRKEFSSNQSLSVYFSWL